MYRTTQAKNGCEIGMFSCDRRKRLHRLGVDLFSNQFEESQLMAMNDLVYYPNGEDLLLREFSHPMKFGLVN